MDCITSVVLVHMTDTRIDKIRFIVSLLCLLCMVCSISFIMCILYCAQYAERYKEVQWDIHQHELGLPDRMHSPSSGYSV
jgi:hypothetical protein